jgi:predicted DNA-binding transcriptional regulator YafY
VLSEPEARAIARSLLTAKEYLGAADATPIELLIDKLAVYVPPARPASFESVSGSLHSAPDVSVSAELIDACDTAIRDRRRMQFLYFSAHRNETTGRTVHPYHLQNNRGEWYLIAWCEWRKDVRQFYLGRIRQWRLLPGEGSYTVIPGFDAETYLSQGFGSLHGDEPVVVRLVFSAKQSIWIRERTYHPTQHTTELPDGRLELTMTVAGTQEALRWILGYGAEVEILEPNSLRQEAAETAKKLTEIYRENTE